ncbi:MAG TPA: GH25 family lysozyme [Clostridia bacterium]
MLNGYDFSYANGQPNFDLLAPYCDFIIARTSYGTGFRDVQYDRNKSEARRIGKILGHYHYAYPEYNTPEAEADWFISQVDFKAGEFLALDFEEKYSGDNNDWARRFLEKVSAHFGGYKPFFYSYLALIENMHFGTVISDGDPLWLAVFDNNASTTYSTGFRQISIKQYKDNATVSGVSGSVDEDSFLGSTDDLKKLTYLYQPNMVNVKTLWKHVNDWITISDTQQPNEFSDPVWNAVKDQINAKYIEIQRLADGTVKEDIVLDVNAIVKPLNDQIKSLTASKQEVANQLSNVTGELATLQTKDGLDQETIIKLNAQVTQLTDAISKLRQINGNQPIVPVQTSNILTRILLSIISYFHK